MNLKTAKQEGYILILGIVVMAILITMSAAVWGYTATQVKYSRMAVNKVEAWHIAEAGVDKALSQLNSNQSFTGEANIALANGTYTTSVSSIDSSNKMITSTAYVPNSTNPESTVTVKVKVSIDLSSVAFNFGVQVGAGGLSMRNNSQVNGNVYSNGNITGSGRITGDATVAGGGSPTADQQCTTNNANFPFNASDRVDVAQKFVPSTSGSLTKISAYIKKTGAPSDITVRIVTNNTNKPSKTQVGGNGTITSSTVTTSYGWIDATFATSPTLTAGTTYWVILDTSNTSSNYYTWADDSTGASCTGNGAYSDNWNKNPNPSWTTTTADFNVKTYMGGVATYLTGVTVSGNARAHSVQSCTIGGNAYYSVTNTCTVTGTSNSGTADSAQQAMPISQAQIDEWESVATSGGTISGNYSVSGTETFGPKKINGNLTVTNGATLYITGPIWVNGNITVDNNGRVIVDSSLGNAGTVLIADKPTDLPNSGRFNISNNGSLLGNNNSGSYLLAITTNSSTTAMTIDNNASGAIYYAANGTVVLSNNAGGSQITGYAISMANNSTVTYQIGLQSADFSNGPGGAWAIVPGTYLIAN